MILSFDTAPVGLYKNSSQKIRVMTEDWVFRNLYCPSCGADRLEKYKNNHPVGVFFCPDCCSDYELKSAKPKNGGLPPKINDGAYDSMIKRITSSDNPHFFFMIYENFSVRDFILIPNSFFFPQMIIKRNPLSSTTRRAGWIGCQIDLSSVPESGKIFIIKNQIETDKEIVVSRYRRIKGLKQEKMDARGWLMDVLTCIDKIPGKELALEQVYAFEPELKKKHPENRFIKEKIRQQLQFLCGKNFLKRTAPGRYRKPD